LKESNNKSATAIEPAIEAPKRKHRFSTDTANDLLFWGCHLLIVGISLGIMWVKIDGTNKALKELLKAQNNEIDIVKDQVLKADQAYEISRKAEEQRSLDVRTAQNTLTSLVTQVEANQQSIRSNQDSIKAILDTVGETNRLILKTIQQAELAALKSEQASENASTKATTAAKQSGRTANVVATKVVTQSDKVQIQAQQKALAQKQQQLSKTISRVKKQGPTFWDKFLRSPAP
jgi:hypothetical protein